MSEAAHGPIDPETVSRRREALAISYASQRRRLTEADFMALLRDRLMATKSGDRGSG